MFILWLFSLEQFLDGFYYYSQLNQQELQKISISQRNWKRKIKSLKLKENESKTFVGCAILLLGPLLLLAVMGPQWWYCLFSIQSYSLGFNIISRTLERCQLTKFVRLVNLSLGFETTRSQKQKNRKMTRKRKKNAWTICSQFRIFLQKCLIRRCPLEMHGVAVTASICKYYPNWLFQKIIFEICVFLLILNLLN